MTDREMLELAAKAAGVEWEPATTEQGEKCDASFGLWIKSASEPYEGQRRRFSPLNDDGDALRLAVKLGLAIYPPEAEGDGATISTPGVDGEWITEECTGDLYAATRRAIVRAAAELGKTKP